MQATQGGDGIVALAGLGLRLGQLQRGQGAEGRVALADLLECGAALVRRQAAGFVIGDHLGIATIDRHAALQLLALPPLPAGDGAEAQCDAADQAKGVAAYPGADAFALFVFVEQVI